jgi:hypothetical protein
MVVGTPVVLKSMTPYHRSYSNVMRPPGATEALEAVMYGQRSLGKAVGLTTHAILTLSTRAWCGPHTAAGVGRRARAAIHT